MKKIGKIKERIFSRYFYLNRKVIELNNLDELKKVFNWKEDPILDRRDIYDYNTIEDANERRIRDAEVLAATMRNVNPKIALEIGTSSGEGTSLMAVNAPECTVHTVNIAPEEIIAGKGGKYTTIALEINEIGKEYKLRGLKNINQIYANTATWEPNLGKIDVAFIDGCHDTKFVFNDTKKILRHTSAGSFILWHDFNPELANKFDWIDDVCMGVEKLYRAGLIKGRIYHLKDSWIGLYKI